MQIKELTRMTGIQDKTIRYYESIGVLPEPTRLPNGYRDYNDADVERLKFVISARRLGLPLEELARLVRVRDGNDVPDVRMLDLIQRQANTISDRISELEGLETELRLLRELGMSIPPSDIDDKDCQLHG